MKVLWLTNILMPDLAIALGKTPSSCGGWTVALADALVKSKQVELGIATNIPGVVWRKDKIHGVQYYAIPMPKGKVDRRRLPPSLIRDYQHVMEDFQPDVIHIHGTEYFHGLLTGRGYLKCPTAISIQGIIDVCQKHYWGNISLGKLLTTRTLRDWVRMDGLIEQKIKWLKRARWEREIFAANTAFIGRTLWDRAHTRRLNPKSQYYHCDELIRQPFYDAQWDISKIKRHSIFASSASYPIKGFHVLVKAVALLRNEFPDITVRTPLARFYPT
jgi:glycosyltransferase involved in cell wall biosynthesis